MKNKLKEWELAQTSFAYNEHFIYKQINRCKRNRLFMSTFKLCACCFALIFVLANTSTTYIKATQNIPLLSKFNEILNLNDNVYIALNNDYVQEINITKTSGDLTVTVDNIIADEKNVYVFYRPYYKGKYITEDDISQNYYPFIQNLGESNGLLETYGYETKDDYHVASIELGSSNIILDTNIKRIKLEVEYEKEKVEFEIRVYDSKVAKKKVIETNQEIIINGQTLTISKIEVYPLSMRIHTKQDENNEYWIKNLIFEVKTGNEVLESIAKEWNYYENNYVYGITSPYFLGNNYKITLKSAELIKKNQIATLDLNTYEYNDPTGYTSYIEMKEFKFDDENTQYVNYKFNAGNREVINHEIPMQLFFDSSWRGWRGSSARVDENNDLIVTISGEKEEIYKSNELKIEILLGERIEINKKIKK